MLIGTGDHCNKAWDQPKPSHERRESQVRRQERRERQERQSAQQSCYEQ